MWVCVCESVKVHYKSEAVLPVQGTARFNELKEQYVQDERTVPENGFERLF